MDIIKINEYEIDLQKSAEIQRLLTECFPGIYPENRIFFKQAPHFRLLVHDEKDVLVGQAGLDYRVMNLDGKLVRVLGIIDLCVKKEYRSQGIASQLLKYLDEFSVNKNIDFSLLFADDPSVYRRNGYVSAANECRWLKINDENLMSFAIGEEVIGELMVKETGSIKWNEGSLDLLGYLY
ncbi:GNAT family N-acetyltransferase [Bacillus sp. AK031]